MPVGEGWDLTPGAEPWSDFHWFQASTRGVLVLVVLSESAVWYTGHFVGGRMCPCIGHGCDFCAAAIGAQVRYCVSCAEVTSRRVGLIEFGRSNGLLLRDWTPRAGGLRGMTIEVSKHSKSVQSRTELAYVDRICEPWFLSLGVPDPCLALYLTWQKAGMAMPEVFAKRMADSVSEKVTPRG